jgi:6-phosphogluconolactonase/glucosamine-6-phosphate isomerase/deaminase
MGVVMITEYIDAFGKLMSREEVHRLPAEELAHRSGHTIHIFAAHDELYDALADIMIEAVVRAKGHTTTMILPVGPTLQYPVFARKVAEKKLDLSRLWTFNMDEFLDRKGRTVAMTHPLSFRAEMMKKLFTLLPASAHFPVEQMFFPRHDNLEEIDRAFDTHAPEGADLCLAGVGPEGHVAFNENPNVRHVRVSEEEFLDDRTRLVLVNTSTVDMDALVAGCGDRAAIPPFAVTIGPHDLLRSKAMVLAFFAGRFQRFALREVLFRRPTMHFPGTLCTLKKSKDGSFAPRTRENLRILCTREEAGTVESRTV